jgi:hypothetical protein
MFQHLRKLHSRRPTLVATGFGCLGLFFWGLAEIAWANESGSAINLVGWLLGTGLGGIGAAYVGWVAFTKSP